jgi:hypothetical protein
MTPKKCAATELTVEPKFHFIIVLVRLKLADTILAIGMRDSNITNPERNAERSACLGCTKFSLLCIAFIDLQSSVCNFRYSKDGAAIPSRRDI